METKTEANDMKGRGRALRSAFHFISLTAAAVLSLIVILLVQTFLLKSLSLFIYLPFVAIVIILLICCVSIGRKSGFSKNKTLQLIIKRMLDILTSSLGIMTLAPLLLAVSIAIKLTSKGPIFFRQLRIGLGGRRFWLYKFRTMYTDISLPSDVSDLSSAYSEWLNMKKKWITPLGGFLRKVSLDELPQLFNVLLGDMSLVGPRPLAHFEGLHSDSKLLNILPGITCLWQVSGAENISYEEWKKSDEQYMENWSILLDIKIMLKIIPTVLFGIGSY